MTLETLERLVDTYLFYSYPQSALVGDGHDFGEQGSVFRTAEKA